MAFLGSEYINENKTSLTIALDKLGQKNDRNLFNDVLFVLEEYCDSNEYVYVLEDSKVTQSINENDTEFIMVFSNEYQAKKYNRNQYSVKKKKINNLLTELICRQEISGINLDRATSGLLINKTEIFDLLFGVKDIYRLRVKNWGKGVPKNYKNQLMNKEMILDFGIQIVHDYLLEKGYDIAHESNRLDSLVNIVAVKNNKPSFIVVETAIATANPAITDDKKHEVIDLAYRYRAAAYYAPVSIGSTDQKRFDKSIALQGDGYYANFTGLERLESQFS